METITGMEVAKPPVGLLPSRTGWPIVNMLYPVYPSDMMHDRPLLYTAYASDSPHSE